MGKSVEQELGVMMLVLQELADKVDKEAAAREKKFAEKQTKKAARKAKSTWGKK
jgi:hypothetical protein